jgi:hypothetical protein
LRGRQLRAPRARCGAPAFRARGPSPHARPPPPRALGYEPKTNLREGLKAFVDWFYEYYGPQVRRTDGEGRCGARGCAAAHGAAQRPPLSPRAVCLARTAQGKDRQPDERGYVPD